MLWSAGCGCVPYSYVTCSLVLCLSEPFFLSWSLFFAFVCLFTWPFLWLWPWTLLLTSILILTSVCTLTLAWTLILTPTVCVRARWRHASAWILANSGTPITGSGSSTAPKLMLRGSSTHHADHKTMTSYEAFLSSSHHRRQSTVQRGGSSIAISAPPSEESSSKLIHAIARDFQI